MLYLSTKSVAKEEDKMQDYETSTVDDLLNELIASGDYRGFWDGHTFKIFSYSTLIASADGINREYLNVNRYSVTTSRLQNIIKTAWRI